MFSGDCPVPQARKGRWCKIKSEQGRNGKGGKEGGHWRDGRKRWQKWYIRFRAKTNNLMKKRRSGQRIKGRG